MAYLLISVACSVLVSVLLKLMQRRGIDTAQGITWNYLAASLLCFGLLDPPLAALGHADTPWAELALLVQDERSKLAQSLGISRPLVRRSPWPRTPTPQK